MRNDVGKVVGAEWFKLKRRRWTYVLLALAGVLSIAMFLALEYAARRDWIGIPSGHFVTASVAGWLTTVMMIVAVIIPAFLISQEFALGTVKSTWVRPVTRGRWFTAKVVVAASAVGALFVVAFAITALLALTRLGFSDLVEKNYTIHTAPSLNGRLLMTVGLTVWTLCAATVFAAALAVMFKHAGGAIAAGLGAGVAMMVLGVVPPLRPLLLTTHVSMPWEQMIAMSKGLPLPVEWGRLLWQTLAGAGVWMAVAFVIGQRVVHTKQITN
jgi:ABC-type transport system involved in multi-copper enzyme maturation permease subunit